jgi:hypothetical protein
VPSTPTSFALSFLCVLAMSCARAGPTAAPVPTVATETIVLHDGARGRDIPVELYSPHGPKDGLAGDTTTLVVISNGYGVANVSYSFIAKPLASRGFVVASVQHDLVGDEPLARTGDLYARRRPAWERGAQTLAFVVKAMKMRYGGRLRDKVVLVGHSNGGDISMWFATEHSEVLAAVITLDHRRVPIPRVAGLRVLTLRAGDTTADPGVLPTVRECETFKIEVVGVSTAKHNELHDGGNRAVNEEILNVVLRFLADRGRSLGGHSAP